MNWAAFTEPFVQLGVAGFAAAFGGIGVALLRFRAPSQHRRRLFTIARALMLGGTALCGIALVVLFTETS